MRALTGSWDVTGWFAPRRVLRNTRLMVPVCIALICGSFAAAAILSMRLDRAHALNQAGQFEQIRAADLAEIAGTALDRLAQAGLEFDRNPDMRANDPAIRNIAIFHNGLLVSALKPRSALPPQPSFGGSRTVFASGPNTGLAVRDGDRIIAVMFDPAVLAPHAVMRRAAIFSDAATILSGTDWRAQGVRRESAMANWPLTAATEADDEAALASWRDLLPLYLFVILGPAITGGWLAALFAGASERHEKAAHAIRSLKTLAPD